MTAKQAVTILRKHNKWRRGDDRVKQADPKEISIAIDIATTMMQWMIDEGFVGERMHLENFRP